MNRREILIGATAIAASGSLSQVAFAQAQGLEKAKVQALMGGDYSTATSELAASRAHSPAARTFAKLEIAEQAAVAEAFGSRPGAAGLSERHARIVERLSTVRGGAFDMMYIDGQIDGHQELLAIHKRYARRGRDPMARGASIVGVAAIQSHLTMLKAIKGMLG